MSGIIAGRQEIREEARAVLPVLKSAATQVAGEEGVRQVIGRRFALYPQPDRSDEEWAAWWADYYDTLAGVSWAALEAAMAVWVADPASEFLPKPGKLLELAKTTPNRAIKHYDRVRRAMDICRLSAPYDGPSEEVVSRREPTEAEKAEVRAMLASYQAKVSERTVEKVTAPLPSTAGKPDERGITPEMRALIERRRG